MVLKRVRYCLPILGLVVLSNAVVFWMHQYHVNFKPLIPVGYVGNEGSREVGLIKTTTENIGREAQKVTDWN